MENQVLKTSRKREIEHKKLSHTVITRHGREDLDGKYILHLQENQDSKEEETMQKSQDNMVVKFRAMEKKEFPEYGQLDRAKEREVKEVKRLLMEKNVAPPEMLQPIIDREKVYLQGQKEVAEQEKLKDREEGNLVDENLICLLDAEGDSSIRVQ